MRLHTKAATLALATAATVGMFAAPANADVHRGKSYSKAYCGKGKYVSWMYTDQNWDNYKNFYFTNHCSGATHIKVHSRHFNGQFEENKYNCFGLRENEHNKKPKIVARGGGYVYKVYLVKHC